MAFKNVANPDMVMKSAAIAEAFTPEMYAYLLSLVPTPQSYAELHNSFEASYADSLKGAAEKVKECEEQRKKLDVAATVLYGFAKAVAPVDPKVPETLRLDQVTEKAPSPSALLPVPHDFKVIYDPSGTLLASVARVPGAKGYQIWVCEGDPNVEANWRLLTSSPTCRRIVINGLNRAKPNWLRIRAMRSNDAGPWSNCVILPV